jgi:hypothetical protein
LDYPLHDSHKAGYKIIKKYLPSIKGFKSVIIIERDRNFGAVDNFFDLIDQVFKKYDRVIISEDDNVFSIDFLAFVNKGLEVYEKRSDIFSISGYQYPIKVPKAYKDDVYIWTGFSAWGVGIWKEKWRKVQWEKEAIFYEVNSFLKNPKSIIKHFRVANHFGPGLLSMLNKNTIHGDTYLSMYMFVNKMYSVFPAISRVRNTGHDGSGVNGGFLINNPYIEQILYNDKKSYSFDIDVKPDSVINKLVYNHFKISFKSLVKFVLKLIKFHFNKISIK